MGWPSAAADTFTPAADEQRAGADLGAGNPGHTTAGRASPTRTDPEASGTCPFLLYLLFIGE